MTPLPPLRADMLHRKRLAFTRTAIVISEASVAWLSNATATTANFLEQ